MPNPPTAATAMAFSRFAWLPNELRQLIWKLALPEDEPEVCIPTPRSKEIFAYTAYPTLMHVCHESRLFVQNSLLSGVSFRFSDEANCSVPVRPFQPDLDTLYCHDEYTVYNLSINSLIDDVGYLAMPPSVSVAPYVDEMMSNWKYVVCLSVVFSISRTDRIIHDDTQRPKRRCKLEVIEEDLAKSFSFKAYTIRRDDASQTLDGFMLDHFARLEMAGNRYLEHFDQWNGENFDEDGNATIACAWDAEVMSFQSLFKETQRFLEYHSGRWVEA